MACLDNLFPGAAGVYLQVSLEKGDYLSGGTLLTKKWRP
jgi:hypothetical protein